MHETRVRRANDAVLTEMARSLLREDLRAGMERRPDPLQFEAGMARGPDPLHADPSAGRSAAGQADGARYAARRFRREPSVARHRVRPLAAPPS